MISNFWHGFNKDMRRIDAVYERVHDDTIVFFVGANYYEFAANAAKPGYPRWAPHAALVCTGADHSLTSISNRTIVSTRP